MSLFNIIQSVIQVKETQWLGELWKDLSWRLRKKISMVPILSRYPGERP
jgi:hypothetical protein